MQVEYVKIACFRPVERSSTQTPYRRKFVSYRHDGALAEEDAVLSTTFAVVAL